MLSTALKTADAINYCLYREDTAFTKGVREHIAQAISRVPAYSTVSAGTRVLLGKGQAQPPFHRSIDDFNTALNPARKSTHILCALPARDAAAELLNDTVDAVLPPSFEAMTTSNVFSRQQQLAHARNQCTTELGGAIGESAIAFIQCADRGAFAPSAQALASGATAPLDVTVSTEPALFATLLCLLHHRLTSAGPGRIIDLRCRNFHEWVFAAFRPALQQDGTRRAMQEDRIAVRRSEFLNPTVKCSFCERSDIDMHAEPVSRSVACGECALVLHGIHWVLATGILCDARPSGPGFCQVTKGGADVRDDARMAVDGLYALEHMLTAGGVTDYRQKDLTEEMVSNFLDEVFDDDISGPAASEVRRNVTTAYISAGAGGGVLESRMKELGESLSGAIDDSEPCDPYAGKLAPDIEMTDLSFIACGPRPVTTSDQAGPPSKKHRGGEEAD